MIGNTSGGKQAHWSPPSAVFNVLSAGILAGLCGCLVAGVFLSRPVRVLPAVGLLSAAAALLYLLRFARRAWRPVASAPFRLHLPCIALIVLPSCLTSIAPARSALVAAAILTVFFAHHAFREAFLARRPACLTPRAFGRMTAAAALVLVLARFGVSAARADRAILPWYLLAPPAGVPVRPFDHLFDLLLVLALPVAVATARLPGARAPRVLGGTAAAGIVLAVALSLARGAWLALGVEAMVLAVAARRRTRVPRIALLGAAVPVLVLAAIPAVRMRALSAFDLSAGTAAQRLDQWAVALAAVTEAPVLGHGLGTFGDLYAAARGGEVWYWCPHNLYLHIAVECGIPALCIFLGWVFLLVRQLAPSRRRALVNGVDWRAAMFHAGIISVCGLLAYGFVDL